MAKQLFGICASPLRTSSDPLCPSVREIHISQTREYFIIPWQGLRSHHPGAQGCCQLHSRAGCQCPSTCQLSAPFTPLLPGWRQESLKRWQNRSSSADTCWHSAIRILSFSLSLLSESYMGKDALPAWIAICSPQCSRKAASNQSSLTFFLALLKWFRVSGCQYFFFFKRNQEKDLKKQCSSDPGIEREVLDAQWESQQWNHLFQGRVHAASEEGGRGWLKAESTDWESVWMNEKALHFTGWIPDHWEKNYLAWQTPPTSWWYFSKWTVWVLQRLFPLPFFPLTCCNFTALFDFAAEIKNVMPVVLLCWCDSGSSIHW